MRLTPTQANVALAFAVFAGLLWVFRWRTIGETHYHVYQENIITGQVRACSPSGCRIVQSPEQAEASDKAAASASQ